jgi:hypothetical protein
VSTDSTTDCCCAQTFTLDDRGHLGVDPEHRLLVGPRPREEFEDGEQS